jgi:ketosteroid isomerase-like protein
MIIAIVISMLACNSPGKEQNQYPKSTSGVFDKQKARAFIDSMNAKWSEQVRNGDSMALASHYSSDAELLMDNSEPIKGKDILSAWGSMLRMGLRDWTFTTTDLQGDENFLVETGSYDIKDVNKKLVDRGKYVVVWKKENGEWKLYRDIGAGSPLSAK